MHRWLAVAVVLVLVPAVAGCASKKETPAAQQDLDKGSNGVTSDPVVVETPKPKGMSERWHFHDYWKGSPIITLLSADVQLNATVDDNGAHVLSTLVSLPQGVIVPAETGFLLVNVSWAAGSGTPASGTLPAGGEVNLTYRPSDSNDYFDAGNASNGKALRLNTTESMCDVPHRQESLWRFNFSAVGQPDAPSVPPALPGLPAAPTSPGAPSQTVHVTVTATIGRPLFIDPPHLNWWQGSDILPLVAKGAGDVAFTTNTPANLTLPKDPNAAQPSSAQRPVRVPVDQGRIVPEGATSIVVLLNWTSSVPGAKLALAFAEGNNPSQGSLTVAKDGAASRVFSMAVTPPQTDTTYSNRTTWEFQIKADPTGPQAFQGSFTLVAWATKLAPADAVKALVP